MKRRVFTMTTIAALGAVAAAILHAGLWEVVIVWALFNIVYFATHSGAVRRWLTMTRSQYPH